MYDKKKSIDKHIKDWQLEFIELKDQKQAISETVDKVKEVRELLAQAKDKDEKIRIRYKLRQELQRLITHIRVFPLKSSVPTSMDGYPFESKFISHMFIRYKSIKKIKVLKNVVINALFFKILTSNYIQS